MVLFDISSLDHEKYHTISKKPKIYSLYLFTKTRPKDRKIITNKSIFQFWRQIKMMITYQLRNGRKNPHVRCGIGMQVGRRRL